MKAVIFHPSAEQELVDAAAYYEEQRPGLGLAYLEEIEHAVSENSLYLLTYNYNLQIAFNACKILIAESFSSKVNRGNN